MNKDTLTVGTGPDRLRRAAYRVITRTQDDPAVQVLGMGVALYATCEALGLDIRQILTSCERMKNDADGPFNSTFDALKAYARKEIGRQ